MEITLEKIELVKDRTGVTYAEAKIALEEADGSVVDAIIAIEETINAGQKGRGFGKKGEALFESIKNLVKKGNVAKIQVKRDGEMILNVPINAGVVGVVIAPIAAVVAVVAAFGFKCVIEVVRDDGTIIDVSDAVTDTMGKVVEKSSTAVDEVKEKGAELYQKGKEKAGEAVDKMKKASDEDDLEDENEDASGGEEAEAGDGCNDAAEDADETAGEEDKADETENDEACECDEAEAAEDDEEK